MDERATPGMRAAFADVDADADVAVGRGPDDTECAVPVFTRVEETDTEAETAGREEARGAEDPRCEGAEMLEGVAERWACPCPCACESEYGCG